MLRYTPSEDSFWGAANVSQFDPAAFFERYVEGKGRDLDTEQLEQDLQVMNARAKEGFRSPWDMSTGRVPLQAANSTSGRVPLQAAKSTYSFQAKDDPMIMVYNKQGEVIKRHHYLGPAVMLFYDEKGALKHIDFVGVCDYCGEQRQAPNADYVGEHARLYVQTGEWRYRDECGRKTAEISSCNWASEKPAGWQPKAQWLEPFKRGKTFVLHEFQPLIIPGPSFSTVWNMATAPELFQMQFDRSRANEWVNAMLLAVGTSKRCQVTESLKQEAEKSLHWVILYGLAMTNAGQQFAVAGR